MTDIRSVKKHVMRAKPRLERLRRAVELARQSGSQDPNAEPRGLHTSYHAASNMRRLMRRQHKKTNDKSKQNVTS